MYDGTPVIDVIEVCVVRNGERCKDCIYYGKKCEKVKRLANGEKPLSLDEYDKSSLKELMGRNQFRKRKGWKV